MASSKFQFRFIEGRTHPRSNRYWYAWQVIAENAVLWEGIDICGEQLQSFGGNWRADSTNVQRRASHRSSNCQVKPTSKEEAAVNVGVMDMWRHHTGLISASTKLTARIDYLIDYFSSDEERMHELHFGLALHKVTDTGCFCFRGLF